MKTWTEIQQQWNRPRRPGSFRDLAEAMKWELRREQETAGESGKQNGNAGRGPAFGAPIMHQSEEEPPRPRFDSIRRLAESLRQDAWKDERALREQAARQLEGVDADEDMSSSSDSQLDISSETEAAYHGPPLGGNFHNRSDISIYIKGEAGKGMQSEIRVVKPGNNDAPYFDADFFKLQGQWRKIHGGANVTVKGSGGMYEIKGRQSPAKPEVAQDCEESLQEYLRKKKKKSDFFIFEE